MFIVLKGGNLYSPEFQGKKDILLAGTKIIAISDKIVGDLEGVMHINVDCSGKNIYPGFIDAHVHITGGGGEGGFASRTPEINLSEITTAGVTTVVGCLGTDGTTRTMTNLIAKANALTEEGITAFAYTGSYQVPVRTLTNNIQDDIVLIDKLIGVGEIAISDHRSSEPTVEELVKIATGARVGGILSGKAGIVNMHLGDGKEILTKIYEVLDISDVPITQFIPTHMNRNPEVFAEAIKYARKGGYVDFTTSTTEKFLEEGETSCSKGLRRFLDEKISVNQITFTSDGQGSLPMFDTNGNCVGLQIGRLSSLYDSVVDSVKEENIPLEVALKVITENPARILKLKDKGTVEIGKDADIVIADSESMIIDKVIAKGQIMVDNGIAIIKGSFE